MSVDKRLRGYWQRQRFLAEQRRKIPALLDRSLPREGETETDWRKRLTRQGEAYRAMLDAHETVEKA